MDLFIINRYKEPNDEEDLTSQEFKHLQKLKQKIEERKKAHIKKKPAEEITLIPEPVVTQQEEQDIVEENDKEIIPTEVNDGKEVEEETIEETKKIEKPASDFKVLGVKDFQRKVKVKRVLPYWLSHTISIPTKLHDLTCKVDEQTWLHETLRTTLLSDNVTHLFPVQEIVIPFVLEQHKLPYPFWPHDICVSAPTGSGKTLTFVLPIVQVLMNQVGRQIRALVVLPVQELATQVAKVFKKFATKAGLKVALLSGSVPLGQEQKQLMRYTDTLGWTSEVDIVVCTAGRLVEHIQNTEGFSLKHLKFLVIDEADRIMDHIQNDWLYHLDKHIKLDNELMAGKPSLSWNNLLDQRVPPHKLLFSATLSQDPEKLEQWGLFQPKLFSAGTHTEYEDDDQMKVYTTPDELKEEFVVCSSEEKPLVLYHLLVEKKRKRVLCFTNAAQSAHRLTTLLSHWAKDEIKVAELSAALDRTTRENVLKKFQNSEIDVLIGTDALARGIDIPNCDNVISYDPPKNIKTYIHRVGRTGRAGREGRAATILLQNQVHSFKDTLKAGGKTDITEIKTETNLFDRLSQTYANAISATKNLIQEEITSKVKKSIALKRGPKSKNRKRKPQNSTSEGNPEAKRKRQESN